MIGRKVRIGVGSGLMVLGAAMLTSAVAIREIAFSGGGLGYHWVNQWYEKATTLPENIYVRGSDVPPMLMVYGAASVLFGMMMTVSARQSRLHRKQEPLSSALIPMDYNL